MDGMNDNKTWDESKVNRDSKKRFDFKDQSQPEGITLGGTRIIQPNGAPVKVVFLADQGDGYDGLSMAEARERLGIPATEGDDVVVETIRLMAEDRDDDYVPFISEEPGYELPGDDAVLSTAEWYNPIPGITWDEYADTWEPDGDDEGVYVRAKAVIDAEQWGWEDSVTALEAVVASHAAENGDWAGQDHDVEGQDGKIYLPVADHFPTDAFEPRIVTDRLNKRLTDIDPAPVIREVKRKGVILTDAALRESREKAGRPTLYAVANGRVPSDAEMVAICREFRVRTTLLSGYLVGQWAGEFPEGMDEAEKDKIIAARNVWIKSRKKD